MCRAVWVILVASDGSTIARLRRAVGPEAQVVDITPGIDALDGQIEADLVIVDGASAAAAGGAEDLRARMPRAAVLWVGPDAPAAAHHAVPYDENLEEALPGAITKALITRNATGRNT